MVKSKLDQEKAEIYEKFKESRNNIEKSISKLKNISDDKKVVEKENLRLTALVKNLRAEIKRLVSKLDDVERENKSILSENDNLRESIILFEDKINQAHDKFSKMVGGPNRDQFDNIMKKMNTFKEENKILRERLDSREKELRILKNKSESMDTNNNSAQLLNDIDDLNELIMM